MYLPTERSLRSPALYFLPLSLVILFHLYRWSMSTSSIQLGITERNHTKISVEIPPERLPPNEIYLLHVPKTGTTIFREMIQYMCPTKTSQQVDDIFSSVGRGATPPPCAKTLKPGHGGLNPTQPTNQTIIMLRHPSHRLASGFLHNLHDCEWLQVQELMQPKRAGLHVEHSDPVRTMHDICIDIHHAASATCTNTTTYRRLQSLVLSYVECVRGCSTNMLEGRGCSRQKKKSSRTTNSIRQLFQNWNLWPLSALQIDGTRACVCFKTCFHHASTEARIYPKMHLLSLYFEPRQWGSVKRIWNCSSGMIPSSNSQSKRIRTGYCTTDLWNCFTVDFHYIAKHKFIVKEFFYFLFYFLLWYRSLR